MHIDIAVRRSIPDNVLARNNQPLTGDRRQERAQQMQMTAQVCQRTGGIIVGPEGERQLFACKRLTRLERQVHYQAAQTLALWQNRMCLCNLEANITQENNAKRRRDRCHERFSERR
jgi:hypothetical protein